MNLFKNCWKDAFEEWDTPIQIKKGMNRKVETNNTE